MRLMTITPQKAAQKLLIVRELSIRSAKFRRAIFIIIVKSPSVRMIIGRETSLIRGLRRELMTPRTVPATARSIQSPRKEKPGTSQFAAKIAAQLAKIYAIILIKKLITGYHSWLISQLALLTLLVYNSFQF